MAEGLTYRLFLPVSIHNAADKFHACWIMTTAMSVSEALVMMLLAFPISSMALAWRQMRVSAAAWLQTSTPTVSCLTTPLVQYLWDFRSEKIEERLNFGDKSVSTLWSTYYKSTRIPCERLPVEGGIQYGRHIY